MTPGSKGRKGGIIGPRGPGESGSGADPFLQSKVEYSYLLTTHDDVFESRQFQAIVESTNAPI